MNFDLDKSNAIFTDETKFRVLKKEAKMMTNNKRFHAILQKKLSKKLICLKILNESKIQLIY